MLRTVLGTGVFGELLLLVYHRPGKHLHRKLPLNLELLLSFLFLSGSGVVLDRHTPPMP